MPFPVSRGQAEDPFTKLTFHSFNPETLSPEAKEGLSHVFAGSLFRAGIPLSVFLEIQKPAPGTLSQPSDFALEQFTTYGRLPSPQKRKEGKIPFVPVSLGISIFQREGVALINENCFSCHAGVVRGIVTAGLGNSHIDQASVYSDIQKLFSFASSQRPRRSEKEEQELHDLIEYLKTTLAPTLKYAKSRGDNVGPYGVWKMVSRFIDPENKGLLTYPSTESAPLDSWFDSLRLPTIDPNPWWHLKYKTTCYRYGDAGPYDASHFSLNFTQPHSRVNEEHKAHVERVSKVLAFARETTSPSYPEPLDAEKVEKGRKLFHGEIPITNGNKLSCYRCHGVYKRNEQFTDLSTPGGWLVRYETKHPMNIGTDLAHSDLLMKFERLEEIGKQLEKFYEKEGDTSLTPRFHIPRDKGYLPPPLVGVWASAPYFHNGSVPTVELVLNSKKRPAIWKRENRDPFAYNLEELGLKYSIVTPAEYEEFSRSVENDDPLSPSSLDFRAIYNTRDFGRSNQGHLFGDAMADEERKTVIEFLKSLSGPNI